jgi:hypothetical protein
LKIKDLLAFINENGCNDDEEIFVINPDDNPLRDACSVDTVFEIIHNENEKADYNGLYLKTT